VRLDISDCEEEKEETKKKEKERKKDRGLIESVDA